MPEPSGEVVADGVRRWLGVPGVGRELPEVDLDLRECVQPTHQSLVGVCVPELPRVPGEGVGGERGHDPLGAVFGEVVEERGWR
jgi:hypothetical protein